MVNEGVPVCPSRPVRFPTQPCPLPNDRQSPTADRTTDLIAYVHPVPLPLGEDVQAAAASLPQLTGEALFGCVADEMAALILDDQEAAC